MAEPRRAARIYPSAAALGACPGAHLPDYAVCLDTGKLYRWIPASAATPDGHKVIGQAGGYGGAWHHVREPDLGANLTDASVTLYVGGKRWRRIPAATLGANRTLTLGTTNAAAGDELEVTRLDTTAWTVAIVNGGIGAGTLVTLPASLASSARFYFDGTNWALRSSGLLL